MTAASPRPLESTPAWQWPLDLAAYDRTPTLTDAEVTALRLVAERTGGRGQEGGSGGRWPTGAHASMSRLLNPLHDAFTVLSGSKSESTIAQRRPTVIRAFVLAMDRLHAPYWAWTDENWNDVLKADLRQFNESIGLGWSPTSKSGSGTRTRVALMGYLLGLVNDPRPLCEFNRRELAEYVFGRPAVAAAIERINSVTLQLGYSSKSTLAAERAICELLLINRRPGLEDLSDALVASVYDAASPGAGKTALVSRSLARLGVIDAPIAKKRTGPACNHVNADDAISAEWVSWCDRWYALSTLQPVTKNAYYMVLLMVARWLSENHQNITRPDQWGATLATEFVAAVCHWTVGQYASSTALRKTAHANLGKPLRPRSINGYLAAIRTFFIDIHSAELIPIQFSPQRYFSTPRSVRRKIKPNPRVIDKGIWAKLVWAGQHLEEADLPSVRYPLEMVRAVAAVWLFTALRSDEIARLVKGCVEWQATPIHDTDTGKVIETDAVCYLQVPVNKTTGEFKKPVAPYVGKMIDAWQAVRPNQPASLDAKSASMVDYLFSVRGKNISKAYINNVLIPLLAKKAGFDPSDHRGPITSHRARATIATYLGNSENSMTLIQLMKWLGHANPDSTRNYVQADVSKMAVKVAEGSFFQQNLASIPVIIDTDAIRDGSAAGGAPWKYFDLGHGLCKLSEWSSCRHRMACAKCDYFEPKDSMRIQLLEANGNLNKMLEFVALGEDERQLVEQGLTINQELLSRLQKEPTPSGQTPIELRQSVETVRVTGTVHMVSGAPG